MNKLSFLFIFALTALVSTLKGKDIAIEISLARFLDNESKPYIELYYALDGNSIDLSTNSKGLLYGGVTITATIHKDSSIIAADKFRILLPESSDSSSFNQLFLHQNRFYVDTGHFELHLKIEDHLDEDEFYNVQQEFEIPAKLTSLKFSDFMFLDSFKKSSQSSVFSKSGYDLIPMVNSGAYYFPEYINTMSYYVELYHTQEIFGDNEAFMVKYYLENADNRKVISGIGGFSKNTASEVVPLLNSINIEELPSGNYNFVLQALNKKGEVKYIKKEFFFRKSKIKKIPLLASNDEAFKTFAYRIKSYDSVYAYIRYLAPISEMGEVDFQYNLLREGDEKKMRNYLYSFWYKQNPSDPEGEWNKYHRNVNIVNKLYGTRIKKGYDSDRGRVYLAYGPPTDVEKRSFEANIAPYEIWQYNRINSKYEIAQTNKQFIFGELQEGSRDFELIHSTAIGEINNRSWQSLLRN